MVGTHAVIQDQVQFRALGLAIIDEQHRFGVEQRLALRGEDGTGPAAEDGRASERARCGAAKAQALDSRLRGNDAGQRTRVRRCPRRTSAAGTRSSPTC